MTSTSTGGSSRAVTIRIRAVHLGIEISNGRKVKHNKLISAPVRKDPNDPNSEVVTPAQLQKDIIYDTLLTALATCAGTSMAFGANKTDLANLIKYGASSPPEPKTLAELDLNHGFVTPSFEADGTKHDIFDEDDVIEAIEEAVADKSNNPAEEHYQAVRRVFKCLRQTKDDGIIFWRINPRQDLPSKPIPTRAIDEDDALVPHPVRPDQLGAYFDAAYATCSSTRRSTGAFIITLGGSAIYYKAKWLPTVATSSTEAEFMAAVNCAKAVKYFRSILDELGVKQDGPTMIYGDNVACCHLANSGKPTERARHIDIQYFAIQEWTARKIISLDHTPGRINFSDALTKALGNVLLNRHCTRMMGYAGSPYTTSSNGKIITKTSSSA